MSSPRVAAGKLRWPIQILQPTLEQDSSGGVDPTATSVLFSVWAAVEALTGRELYAAQQRVSEVTHKITIRYVPGVLALMSVLFSDPGDGRPRVFLIADVLNPDETPHLLYLYCVERDDAARGAGAGDGGGAVAPIAFSQPFVFNADGSSSSFVLPYAPSSRGIMLFWNGTFSTSPEDYELAGSVVSLSRTAAPGDKVVVFYL